MSIGYNVQKGTGPLGLGSHGDGPALDVPGRGLAGPLRRPFGRAEFLSPFALAPELRREPVLRHRQLGLRRVWSLPEKRRAG